MFFYFLTVDSSKNYPDCKTEQYEAVPVYFFFHAYTSLYHFDMFNLIKIGLLFCCHVLPYRF